MWRGRCRHLSKVCDSVRVVCSLPTYLNSHLSKAPFLHLDQPPDIRCRCYYFLNWIYLKN